MNKSAHLIRLLASMAVAASFAIPAGSASAALSNGDYLGKTIAEITKNFEEQGYKVHEVKKDDDVFESEVVLDGKLYEISSDFETGKIVDIELEEEDEDEDEENDGSIINRLSEIGNENK